MLKLEKEICGLCGACVAVCQLDALNLETSQLEIISQNCNLCGECVSVCPVGALDIEDE